MMRAQRMIADLYFTPRVILTEGTRDKQEDIVIK